MSELLSPAEARDAAERIASLQKGLNRVLLDQPRVVEQVVVAVLARGHALFAHVVEKVGALDVVPALLQAIPEVSHA